MPDPGAPAGAVRGRWRIQPPCGQVGPLDGNSVFTNNNKGCVPPAAGCDFDSLSLSQAIKWQHCLGCTAAKAALAEGSSLSQLR